MITQQIKILPAEYRPKGKLLSAFNQKLGITVQSYEIKIRALSRLVSILSAEKTPHLLVKGAVLRFIYPVPELRTSGDTDVVIDPSDYEKTIETLKKTVLK